jgi:hypothetical protein
MSHPTERPKRPSLPRTNPIRTWTSLFGAPPPVAANGDAPPAGAPADLGTVIARSVELAYRVMDDYVQQGQRAAERIAGRAYGPDAWVTDAQDVSARVARYASDVMGLWLDAFDGVRLGTPPPAAAPSGNGSAAPEPGGPPWLVIEVLATQPAAVTLDLRPAAGSGTLIVHALRDAEVDKPPLRDVTVERAAGDGPSRVRVRVPPGQPAGTYHGLIVDEATNRPVGSVSVRLGNG